MPGRKRIHLGVDVNYGECGVYLIVSPSGRRYVGSSNDLRMRLCDHNKNLGGSCIILSNSLKKYGWEAHKKSILIRCNLEDRLFFERVFGDIYLSLYDFGGLNNNLPGYDEIPKIVSKESRKLNSERHIKYHSPEEKRIAKNKMSNDRRKAYRAKIKETYGDQRKFGTKERMSELRILSDQAKKRPEVRQKFREASNKRFENPEERKRVSEGLKKYFASSEDARQKNQERTSKFFKNPETHPRSKKIINIETGEIYACAKLVPSGMEIGSLRKRLKGDMKNKTPYRFLDEYKKQIV